MTTSTRKETRPYELTDWEDISDPKVRRKLQNRQYQRACRARRAKNIDGPAIKHWVPTTGKKNGHFVYASSVSERHDVKVRQPIQDASTPSSLVSATSPDDEDILPMACSMSAVKCSKTLVTQWCDNTTRESWYARWCLPDMLLFVDDDQDTEYNIHGDRLLSLIYYNVLRGFAWNIEILGLDLAQMDREDYVSPFLPLSPSSSSAITRLPSSLQPTEIQQAVDHHPGYDVFPCPKVRNNMIRHVMTTEVESEFCLDIRGLSKSTSETTSMNLEEGDRRGVTIWGDPWELKSWEFSEYIAVKYPWLGKGALELQVYTNLRRRARGWGLIRFA